MPNLRQHKLASCCVVPAHSTLGLQLCNWNRETKLLIFLLGGCGKLFGNFAVGRVASRRTRISMQMQIFRNKNRFCCSCMVNIRWKGTPDKIWDPRLQRTIITKLFLICPISSIMGDRANVNIGVRADQVGEQVRLERYTRLFKVNILIWKCARSEDWTLDYQCSQCTSWALHSVREHCPGVICWAVAVYGVKIEIAVPSTNNVESVSDCCRGHERNFCRKLVCWNMNKYKWEKSLLS